MAADALAPAWAPFGLLMSALAIIASLGAGAIAGFALARLDHGWRWTGFAGRTLWDWMQLLVIPFALAVAAFGLNTLQSERDQRREAARTAQEEKKAGDARREQALRDYVQQMTPLILDGRLTGPSGGTPVSYVARTLTLTVLPRLDGARKGVVLSFLSEAGLIQYEPAEPDDPIGPVPKVSLVGADLRDLEFDGAPVLNGVNLKGAVLHGADFHELDVRGTFEDADLRNADFTGATLLESSLAGACVTDVRFVEADLRSVPFDGAAGVRTDFSGANLRGTDLRGADLFKATFDDASGQHQAAADAGRIAAACPHRRGGE